MVITELSSVFHRHDSCMGTQSEPTAIFFHKPWDSCFSSFPSGGERWDHGSLVNAFKGRNIKKYAQSGTFYAKKIDTHTEYSMMKIDQHSNPHTLLETHYILHTTHYTLHTTQCTIHTKHTIQKYAPFRKSGGARGTRTPPSLTAVRQERPRKPRGHWAPYPGQARETGRERE